MAVDQYPAEKPKIQFGDAGSKWRMMKLKRVIEQAEDEKRSIQEVGLERYGSMDKLNEALAERDYLDKNKRSRRDDGGGGGGDRGRRFVYTDTEKSSASFRRPDDVDEFGRQVKRRKTTPPPAPATPPPQSTSASLPSVDTSKPVIITQHDMPQAFTHSERVMTRDELNKLNADMLKAKLMGKDNAEELEQEYERQVKLFEAAENGSAEQQVCLQFWIAAKRENNM